MWNIKLLDRLQVQWQNEPPLFRFRSRSAAAVLAYIALHINRSVPREEICEAIWPDHEPELSRSSLRTALFSLKKEFEQTGSEVSLIQSDRTHVWLNQSTVFTDYQTFSIRFQEYESNPDSDECFGNLFTAIGFVKGQLLAGFNDVWVIPHQIAFEEIYVQSIQSVVEKLATIGQIDEAITIGRSALVFAPQREDIHVALIRALNQAGRGSEAIRQLEMLERMLDEQWGETPSEEAVAALELKTTPREPTKVPVVQKFEAKREELPKCLVPRLNRRIFGRDQELKQLNESLQPNQSSFDRLWTIFGPGGCGKTVLSMALAHEIKSQYNDHAAFVDLSSLMDSNLVLTKISESLEVPSPGSPDSARRLVQLFNESPYLLILDNIEHLIPDIAELIKMFIEECPLLRILTTSRRLIGIENERVFPISTLPSPTLSAGLSEISQIPSVLLYIDRAQAIQPTFNLNSGNAAAIVETCRRLEGLPLAIELAAAQTSVMSPSQVLLQYGDLSFQLKNRLRDADDRHRSLENVLEWSYGLLTEREQTFFRAIGIFRGSFSAEAAAAVSLEDNVWDLLDSIMKSSLIEKLDSLDGVRFRLLGPIQSYAQKLIILKGENSQLRDRHHEFFLNWAEQRRQGFDGKTAGETALAFESEHENLRQAVDWSISTSTLGASACRIVSCLTHFALMKGYGHEWLMRIEPILKFAKEEANDEDLARGNNSAGLLADSSDKDESRALQHFRSAVEHFKKTGNNVNTAASLSNCGMALTKAQKWKESEKAFEESLATLSKGVTTGLWNPDAVRLAVQCNLSELYRYQDRYEDAIGLLSDAIVTAEKQERLRLVPPILLATCRALMGLERIPEALEFASRALKSSEELGITTNIAEAHLCQAWCSLFREELLESEEHIKLSIKWSRATGSVETFVESLCCLVLTRTAIEPALVQKCLGMAKKLRPEAIESLVKWQRTRLSKLNQTDTAFSAEIDSLEHPEIEQLLQMLSMS